MTLSMVPQYDRDRVGRAGGRAVVVGGSVGGMLAARVLADGFDEVTVLDRDALPDGPATRRGVPQGHQIHLLHEAGRATIEDLLPGYGEDLLSAGGLLLDYGSDFEFYSAGSYLADSANYLPTYLASRPLYEHVVRSLAADVDGVDLWTETHCTDYLLDDAGEAVRGVEIREGEGTRELPADLVVDATGRTSRTPAWLDSHGFPSPVTDEVHIDMAYCSTYVERPPAVRRAYYALPEPPRTRGSLIHPVEGDRWVMTLIGMHGDHPPTDPEGYARFAESLPVPEPARLLEEHPRVAGINKHPFPFHPRHRYEDLATFPAGFLVFGDAITSFNPVYAQGMSVASLEALQLHHALAAGREDLAPRFFDRASAVVDVAWDMAVGTDMGYERTEGPGSAPSWLQERYNAMVNRAAHTDAAVAEAVHRVIRLERRPAALARPAIAWRVLSPFR